MKNNNQVWRIELKKNPICLLDSFLFITPLRIILFSYDFSNLILNVNDPDN